MRNFELTDIEVQCGVTLEAVRELLPKVLFRDVQQHQRAVFPLYTGAALASATARAGFGVRAKFCGMNELGQPVYGPA